jgi:AraC family transcriptional regulator
MRTARFRDTPKAAGFYGTLGTLDVAGAKLAQSEYPARLKMPVHEHEPPYLGLVLKGAYSETLFGRTRERGPLTTVFHPACERHSVSFHDSNVQIFRVEMGSSFRARVQGAMHLPTEPAQHKGGLVTSLALRLLSEYRKRDCWSPLAIEGLLLEIAAALGRSETDAPSGRLPKWLDLAREILASTLSDHHSLAELAQEVGVHPVHLAREFRRRYHCTIGDFVRQRRIEFACKEIARSDAPLSEIALACGFYDQSHFSNLFKRLTGMTPAAYRSACRSS